MDKAKLIKWKSNPVLIGKDEVEELEKLSMEFPFFSLVQVLLARGYKNTNHFRFNGQLKKAALYCEDRAWLYEFLNREVAEKVEAVEEAVKPSKQAKPKVQEITKEKVVETDPIAVVEEKPVPVQDVEIKDEVNVEEKVPVLEERVPEKPFVLNKSKAWIPREEKPAKEEIKKPKVEEKVKAKESQKEEEKPTPKRKPVKKVPVIEVEDIEKVEAKVEKTPEKIEKPVNVEKKKKAKKKGKKAKKRKKEVLDEKALLDELINENIQYNLEDYYSAEEVLEPLEKQEIKVEKTRKKPSVKNEEVHDFFAWLKQADEEKPKEEKAPIVKEEKSKSKSTKKPVKSSKAHESISIIDDFLNSKKTTTRKKAEFFSPVEMARKSDELESEIVSETLAGVYEEQEQYEEAIMTYEKLILLFPQKEAYFAARIKDLRELSNK